MSNAITIDRETASTINPLISSIWTEDTLDQCARVIRDLGYFLSPPRWITKRRIRA